jgi:hypothetical protein
MSFWPKLLVLVPLLIPFVLKAQEYPPQQLEVRDMQADAVPVQPSISLVWQVKSPHAARPSYVFAILYKVPQSYFFLPEGLTPYAESCDRLVMEVNPADENLDFLYRGTLPIDSTLQMLLTRKEYEMLYGFFRDSLSEVANYKLDARYSPLLLSRQMLCDYCLGHRPGAEPVSYEFYLYNAIRKPLKVLSTGLMRNAYLDSYSLQEQVGLLMQNYYARGLLCERYRGIMRAYRDQDLDRLWVLAQGAPDLGDNLGNLIEARNQEWMRTLSWMMQSESLFIAVHAVQLPGEYGLLHLLRKAGFEVRPVYLKTR